jgi:hypothetical protein
LCQFLVLVSSALTQVNEVSITAGRTFVSTQTVPTTGLPVHFGNEESVAFNSARFLKSFKVFGLYAELPVAIYPRMDVNYHPGTTPKDIGALFVTPSVRVNVFSGESVTPWVSVGGGYGRFREAQVTLYENRNPSSGQQYRRSSVRRRIGCVGLAYLGAGDSKRVISTPELPP